MINFKVYDKFKAAKQAGDMATLNAIERENAEYFPKYEELYHHEHLMHYFAVMDAQREKEQRYNEFVGKYGYEIRTNKITPEMASTSFRSEKKEFYNRYVREMGKI